MIKIVSVKKINDNLFKQEIIIQDVLKGMRNRKGLPYKTSITKHIFVNKEGDTTGISKRGKRNARRYN